LARSASLFYGGGDFGGDIALSEGNTGGILLCYQSAEADKGLIPRPLGRLRWFPIDTALLAAGKFITNGSMFKRKELGEK